MAATTIDELQVLITAETKALKRALAEVSGQLDGVGGQAQKANGTMSSAFGKIGSAAKTGLMVGVAASIAAITASIPSAVKRIDTLANSSRTFENMGVDAKDAEKSMDALEKSITGLPTPLDSAVRGMTALTATYGDIDKGQKVFSALNDAILGFGGSTADVDNAILQLSQRPMDGPLDAQTWNSLLQSGLTPVITAMAKDMGMSVGDMKEAFGEGELSVQDFTERLVKMDKEGGGGLKSLEKIARDSTEGIGTTFANMRTSIVRAVAGLLEEIGIENINTGIESIGKAITSVIDVAKLLLSGDFKKGMFGGAFEEDSALVSGILTVRETIRDLWDGAQILLSGDFKKGMFGGVFEEDSPLVDGILNVRDQIMTVFDSLGGAIKSAWGVIKPVADWFQSTLWPILQQLGEYVGGELKSAWESIIRSWKSVSPALVVLGAVIGGALVGGLVLLVAAIAAVLVVGATLINWIINIGEFFINMWTIAIETGAKILDAFVGAWEGIKFAWSTAAEWFTETSNGIATSFQELPGKIAQFFSDTWEKAKSIFNSFVEFVRNNWAVIIVTVITGGLILIVAAVTRNWENIKRFTSELTNSIIDYFSELPGRIGGFFQSAWDKTKSAWSGVSSWFGNVVNSIGIYFSQVPGKAKSSFQNAWDGVKSIWSGVSGWFGNKVREIGNYFYNLPGIVRGHFNNVVSSIKSIDWIGIGADIIRGIGAGISGMAGDLASKAKAAVGEAKDQLKSFLGIHSPSRVMRDEIGKMLGLGVAEGIDASTKNAVGSALKSAKSIMGAYGDMSTGLPSHKQLSGRLDVTNEAILIDADSRMLPVSVNLDGNTLLNFVIDGVNGRTFMSNQNTINL